MVYVSPNISRFGYQAEEFLRGRIMYRDLIYPGDFSRSISDIETFQHNAIELSPEQVIKLLPDYRQQRRIAARLRCFQ